MPRSARVGRVEIAEERRGPPDQLAGASDLVNRAQLAPHLGGFPQPGERWVWGIAIRRLIGVLRKRGRWEPASQIIQRHDDVTVAAEESILEHIEHSDLGPALAGLSPELRAVIEATVFDSLSTREASHLLGISLRRERIATLEVSW